MNPGLISAGLLPVQKEYVEAVRAAPNSVEAHYRLAGFLLNQEKNLSASLSELEAALRINPDSCPLNTPSPGSLQKGMAA